MEMLLIDVNENKVKVVDVDGLGDYYKYIGCRCIDIVNRKIGDKRFEIICDDEGLFVENPKTSAITQSGRPLLVGNLLIASGTVIDCELTPITANDVEYIYNFIVDVFSFNGDNLSRNIAVIMDW